MFVSPFYVSRCTREYRTGAFDPTCRIAQRALRNHPLFNLLPCLGFDRGKTLYRLSFAPSPDTRQIANGYRFYRSLLFPFDKELRLVCKLAKYQKWQKMQITLST